MKTKEDDVARAHLFRPITDREGNLLYNAQVTIRETDYAVPIGQELFASPTGSETLSNPFITPNGVIDVWLDTPQRMSILVEADGVQDILVYLDAPVPPEETVASTTPLEIVNAPTTSGQVLLSTATPGQAQWGTAPSGTGLTPVVVVSSQSFSTGADPAGWTINPGSSTNRTYDPSTLPPGTNYNYSLHAKATGGSGVFTATGPSFTLLEAGTLSVWIKTLFSGTESFTVKVTDSGAVTTTLGTISSTRDWGFYSYNLAPGTYTPKFTYTGPTSFAIGAHDVWFTGYVARYGGNVPPHTHAGSGTNSTALGPSATATATASTAVGASAAASGVNSTAFGYNAHATGNSALAMGANANANADYALAVGANASGSASTTAWTAVGYNASATGLESVAVGKNAAATADYASAIGSGAAASAASTVAIGQGAVAAATAGVALGQNANVGATHINSVAIGAGSATTGANQIVLGNAGAMTVIPGSLQNYGLVTLGMAGSRVGFYGSPGMVQQIVAGSDDGNSTLRSLVQALGNMGLISNQSLQQPASFTGPVGVLDYFYRPDAGDGTLGVSDFDYAGYTYAPMAFSATGPYPSGPQWFVGGDHNGYKGVATGLGAMKNTYRATHGLEVATFSPSGTTNKICFTLRHTGQTDGTAAAAYLLLDQAAGTISLGVKAAGSSLSTTYVVAGGNSQTLSSNSLTPFDGAVHKHQVYVFGQYVLYVDNSTSLKRSVWFYDPALHATGNYAGVDFNTTTTALNGVTLLPPTSFARFGTTGALTNLATGEAWTTAVSGAGASVNVNVAGNVQLIGAASGYALAYFLTNANTMAKVCQTIWTGTIVANSGIVGRVQDAANYYMINSTNITKVSAGTQTNLATHSSAFVSGDTMRVLFGGGGSIQVFRNGTQVSSASDTSFISNNRYGLATRGAGTANWPSLWVYDNYNSAVVYK